MSMRDHIWYGIWSSSLITCDRSYTEHIRNFILTAYDYFCDHIWTFEMFICDHKNNHMSDNFLPIYCSYMDTRINDMWTPICVAHRWMTTCSYVSHHIWLQIGPHVIPYVINHIWTIVCMNYHIWTTIYELPYMNYHIWTTIYELPYMNYHVWMSICMTIRDYSYVNPIVSGTCTSDLSTSYMYVFIITIISRAYLPNPIAT